MQQLYRVTMRVAGDSTRRVVAVSKPLTIEQVITYVEWQDDHNPCHYANVTAIVNDK